MIPRLKKVMRDVTHNPMRSALVVLSMSTGVFAVGLVAGTHRVLLDSMEAQYRRASAASATLFFGEPFDMDLHETVRNMKGIAEAQSRRTLEVRAAPPGQDIRTLNLVALQDYRDIRINRIRSTAGPWPPAQDDMLFEESGLAAWGGKVGDLVEVETARQKKRVLRIAGTVRDPSAAAASLSNRISAFISYDTVEALGEDPRPDALLMQVEKKDATRNEVQETAKNIRNRLMAYGLQVWWSWVPPPGQHPLQEPIGTLLFILLVLGVLVLFLSGFLLVNTIGAVLMQQTRQIGVMKAMGATTQQIAALYLGLVAIFGGLSVALAVPLGLWAARAACAYIGNLLNLELVPFYVPREILAAEVVTGMLVPMVAAMVPVLRASAITVREAVGFFGSTGGSFGDGVMDRVVARVRFLTRPMLLSLRNTFRRKGRLALTLATLSMGGAIFMGVSSVRAALEGNIQDALRYWNYDMEVELARPYRIDRLQQEVRAVGGVVRAETWGFSAAQIVEDWNGKGESRAFMVAPPADTDMLRPTVVEGRWLKNEDEASLVINTEVLRNHPDLRVGDVVKVRVGLHKTEWKVVGMVQSVMMGPMIYANRPYYAQVSGEGQRSSSVQMITASRDPKEQRELAHKMEERLKLAGLQVQSVSVSEEWKGRATRQFGVIVSFLLVMAVLMAVVGALALMGTMGINVLERTREVGIMRSVGAGTMDVVGIFILEGITMGLMSFVLGTLLSLPVGFGLGWQVGQMFTRSPLPFTFSVSGALTWLVLIVILSALASVAPALRAARLRVREVLVAE